MIFEAQYNWRGVLTSYRRENTFIPLDPRNAEFQQVQQALNQGTCVVAEPTLGDIHKACDRYGQFSGYFTRFGFVPIYQDSHLLRLIREQIKDGRCSVLEPPENLDKPEFDLEKLVLCTVLEQPWPHLKGPFRGELAYASNKLSAERMYRFTIKNNPVTTTDKLQLLLADHHIKNDWLTSHSPLQFGVLEIELPIPSLLPLFMGERNLVPSWMSANLADMLEQHYAQTRRKPSQGPDISWLIGHIGQYVGHFVVEFSNHVIDAFKWEYGFQDRPMQPLIEGNTGSNPIIIGYATDGSTRLQSMTLIPGHSHALIGEWHRNSLQRYQEKTKSPVFLHATALERVSEMVKLGFHPEALAPLNAYLEVAIKWALWSCVKNSQDTAAAVLGLGHMRNLEILRVISESKHNLVLFDEDFKTHVTSAKAIYKNRNLYVHAMQLPDVTGRMTLGKRREIEALFHGFLDISQRDQFLIRLQHIAEDTDVIRKIVIGSI